MENIFEDIKTEIENTAQKIFDEKAKPMIIKEMKRLKIKKIDHVMGVNFITLNNGKSYSDDEFSERSEPGKNFCDNYISIWQETPFYQMISVDIDLTK